MKKIFTAVALMCALMLALLIGAGSVFDASVEDMTRDAVLSLTGPREGKIEAVEFSPLTRSLTVTGWSATHQPGTSEAFCAEAKSIKARVTLRGLLGCLPAIGNLFFDDDSVVPVLTDLTISGLAWRGTNYAGSADSLTYDKVSLSYALARQYEAGLRPPIAEACSAFRANRCVLSRAVIEKLGCQGAGFSVEHMDMLDMRGLRAREVRLSGLTVLGPAFELACGSVTLNDFNISPELLSELVASSRPGSLVSPERLQEILVRNGRLFTRAAAEKIARQGRDGLPPFTLERAELAWNDLETRSGELALRGLVVKTENLDKDLPLSLDGLSEIYVDADLTTSGSDAMHEQGEIRLRGLGDLKYSVSLVPRAPAFRDVELVWTDKSLTARVARSIFPDAHAAGMAMKAGLYRLCANGGDEERLQCERLGSFVDAPGTLRISTPRGAAFHPIELLGLAGRLGACLTVEVEPGASTLTTQSEKLFASALPEAGQ